MRASCVICSDLYDEGASIVVAPCGHIFHETCIYKWIDQSSTCPECRKKVTFTNVLKLYFNFAPPTQKTTKDANYLENELSNVVAKLKEKGREIEVLKDEKSQLKCYCIKAEDELEIQKQKVHKLNSEITSLNLILKHFKKNASKQEELEKTNKSLVERIDFYQNIRTVIDGTQNDIEEVLRNAPNNTEGVKQLATYCSLLKRELNNLAESKQKLREEFVDLRKENGLLNLENRNVIKERNELKEQIQSLEKENLTLMARSTSQSSTSSETGVSYESPVPEGLKRKFDDLDDATANVVTPVAERVDINPFPFRQRNFKVFVGNSLQSKTQFTKKFSCSEKLLPSSIKSVPKEDSIIRVGYDGMGGHSKHIFKSMSTGTLKNFTQTSFKKKL